MGSLANMRYLLLASSQLTGAIPAAFGSLTQLQYLELGHNLLTGGIPSSLSKLTFLLQLGLSYNQLSGLIPLPIEKGLGKFETYGYCRIEGNPALVFGTDPRYDAGDLNDDGYI